MLAREVGGLGCHQTEPNLLEFLHIGSPCLGKSNSNPMGLNARGHWRESIDLLDSRTVLGIGRWGLFCQLSPCNPALQAGEVTLGNPRVETSTSRALRPEDLLGPAEFFLCTSGQAQCRAKTVFRFGKSLAPQITY